MTAPERIWVDTCGRARLRELPEATEYVRADLAPQWEKALATARSLVANHGEEFANTPCGLYAAEIVRLLAPLPHPPRETRREP
jgi:hypothetical protein